MTCGFSKKLIPALVCQNDNQALRVEKIYQENETSIFDAILVCDNCKIFYQIKDGIANLLVNQDKLEKLIKDEIVARDKEAADYDRRLGVRYYKEVPSTLKKIGHCHDQVAIEYGCGTGRLTYELVKKCGQIMAIDFSLESLKILAEKLNSRDNVGLVLADAIQFKSKENFFDLALSFQFFEHIPTLEKRENLLANINKTLKKGGKFISTVYHHDLRRRINKQPQEGLHPSGVFFHYFSQEELRNEFKKYFKVINIVSIDITLPLEARLKLSLRLGGFLSRLSEYLPIIRQFGHLLLIISKK